MSKCAVLISMSEDIAVIMATVPAGANIRCSILCRVKKLFFLQNIQTGPGANSAFSSMGNKDSFSRSKAAVV